MESFCRQLDDAALLHHHRWLRHANEGVLPFFILHQPILLGIGYFIVTWGIHDALKWAIIFASAFVVIVMLYVLLIRRIELFRFLFGMKSTHSLSDTFQKGWPLTILHVMYVGLIVVAVVC